LMKSEPVTYSIDDLRKKGGPDVWEGCRNYTVRNFFRDAMNVGDEAFFYHSSCAVPGIVGTMRIVTDVYPDPTQFDPKSHYFDPKSAKDNLRWTTRDVEFARKFKRIVTLDELRSTPGLEDMWVLRRGMRFSVMPVTEAEWAIVMALPGL
jgi:predicted RNA-binding protein with PUA-like domain